MFCLLKRRVDVPSEPLVATCCHCRARKANRPAGLCRACRRSLGVRRLHLPTSKFARKGNGQGCKREVLPESPTAAAPGTEEKIDVMAERAEKCQCLCHPEDGWVRLG
jgi:hypothetical protein